MSSLVRKPPRSHRGPEVRRGVRSSPQKPAERRRRSGPAGALRGSRSAAEVAGGGRAGCARRGAIQASAARSSEARQMPAASCTSHAPLLALRPAPVPPSPSTQSSGEGTHPRLGAAAQLLRCAGSGPGALTPSRSAPACRRPGPASSGALWWWGVGPGGGWACAGSGPGGGRAARRPVARVARGRRGGDLRADSQPGARSAGRDPHNVELPGRRGSRAPPLALSFLASAGLSPLGRDVRGEGLALTLPAPRRPPRGCSHLPAAGRGGSQGGPGSRSGPLAPEMPPPPPAARERAGDPLSRGKGGQ